MVYKSSDEPVASIKDPTEEYMFHLIRAEFHMHRAMELLEGPVEPKRTFRCQMLLRRAHGIIAGIYKQEARW